MTNKEKLKAVIEYAESRGYEKSYQLPIYPRWTLLSHDFAKAVFGEEVEHDFVDDKCINCELIHGLWGGSLCKDGWQYYLQQAVISKDPIDYYYQFITKETK